MDASTIVAALRSLAAKARETRTITPEQDSSRYAYRGGQEASPVSFEKEILSRDAIVGRIEGLADALEAFSVQGDITA